METVQSWQATEQDSCLESEKRECEVGSLGKTKRGNSRHRISVRL